MNIWWLLKNEKMQALFAKTNELWMKHDHMTYNKLISVSYLLVKASTKKLF